MGILDGKATVVTGAGRGLGRACALALAEAGASPVLVSRTESELQAVAAIIAADGGTASTLVCDVTDVRQVESAIGGLERIDILVNAAGFNIPEPLDDVTEEHFDKVITVNVKGTFMVSQAAVRRMRAGGRRSLTSPRRWAMSARRIERCTVRRNTPWRA